MGTSFTDYRIKKYQINYLNMLIDYLSEVYAICSLKLIVHGVLAHFRSGLLVSSSWGELKEETGLNTKPSVQGM